VRRAACLEGGVDLPASCSQPIFRLRDLATSAFRRSGDAGLLHRACLCCWALVLSTYAFAYDRTGLLAGKPNILGASWAVQNRVDLCRYGGGKPDGSVLLIAGIATSIGLRDLRTLYLNCAGPNSCVDHCLRFSRDFPLCQSTCWSRGRWGLEFVCRCCSGAEHAVALMIIFSFASRQYSLSRRR